MTPAQKPRQFMIDTETLSLRPDAAVWQFAMVEFTDDALGAAVQTVLSPYQMADYLDVGLVDCADSTVEWWCAQDNELFNKWWNAFNAETTFAEPCMTVQELRAEITETFGDTSNDIFWAKNAAFDMPIVANVLNYANVQPLWFRRNMRCLYTLRGEVERLAYKTGCPLIAPPVMDEACAHDAFYDAVHQATLVQFYRAELERICKHLAD